MIPVGDLEHLLRRTEFVARPSRVADLSSLTLEQAVDDILDVSRNPSDDIDLAPFTDAMGQVKVEPAFVIHWWLDRMVSVPRPFGERLTFFWHGRLTSAMEKVHSAVLMYFQNQLYRRLGLGSYRSLLQAMAIEPAMLLYLDGARNNRTSPNQNFAREMLELFTLGVGNYTEADVAGVSRAWTGHTVTSTGAYSYDPSRHDTTNKTIFGITRNWTGPEVLDHILDSPTLQGVAARHLARAMWESFAHPGAPTNVVNELGQVFVASGFDVRSLVRAMLLRPEFYSDTAKKGLVRPPVDFVVAILEASGFSASVVNPAYEMVNMGQVPLVPPNVSGWKPNAAWINATTFSSRMSFAGSVALRMQSSGRFNVFAGTTPTEAARRAADIARIRPSARSLGVLEGISSTERRYASVGGASETSSLIAAAFHSPEFNLS